MIRALLKVVLFLVIVAAVGAFVLGYWSNGHLPGARVPEPSSVGTSGHVDVDRARQAGAAIAEKSAVAADRARAELSDAALTAKIKSKMVLDDQVQARRIDVSTSAGVVTLSGTVTSQAERARAIRLATETDGVTSVTDHLQLR